MLKTKPAAELWLDALFESTEELSETMLGCKPVERSSSSHSDEMTFAIALLPLNSDQFQGEIGIMTTKDGCDELTIELLGEPMDDEGYSEEELGDSLGEIINILAGMVKLRVSTEFDNMQLGLPEVLQDNSHDGQSQRQVHLDCQIGSTPIRLYVKDLSPNLETVV